ncbi:MAG: cation:proton antiporter [Candidatus Hydrogenedentes bacterium]|nr:cation:proton antiporter [Candidatus Hydrogenedentota bacterium]
METIYPTTFIVFLVFVASVISVEIALSAAIIEIVMGVIAANVFGLHPAPWLDFVAGFGGILLTFLAGIEVDAPLLRQKFKESLLIGGFSFLVPYVAALAYCYWVAHWTWNASLIAGCALSTTSLAVVYAVLVETGLAGSGIGKLLMASTFVTDMGTALALSLTFAEWGARTLVAAAACVLIIAFGPRYLPALFERYKDKVIEPEIKFLFFLLFVFMSLGKWGQIHAVLPVFVLGLCLSGTFRKHRDLQRKLRIGAFAMITPFFFIKGGMNVSLSELAANWGLVAILFGVKSAAKFVAVFPLARRYANGHAPYLTLLMSTGLTFGTISATYGLSAGHITSSQFSILVSVVIATAVIPTIVAQRWFSPKLTEQEQEELLAQEEESI